MDSKKNNQKNTQDKNMKTNKNSSKVLNIDLVNQSSKEEIMPTLILTSLMTTTKNTNPITLTFMVLATSIMTASQTFKNTNTSWLSFIMILTFSSGMMTLFLYLSSMTPSQLKQNKKPKKIIYLMMTTLPISFLNNESSVKQMKTFSNQTTMMIMTTTLIATMLSVSTHGYHPNQTMSASF